MTRRKRKIKDKDSDKKWILDLIQPQKIAYEWRIVQDHIRRSNISKPSEIELKIPTRPGFGI